MAINIARSIIVDIADPFFIDKPRLLFFVLDRWLFFGLGLLFAR